MTSIARFIVSPAVGFQQIVGDATQLAITFSGMAYALAADGTIWAGLRGDNWKLVRCDNVVFKKIFHGQEGVWALTADGSIYQNNSANDTMVRTNGSLRFISSPFFTNGGDTYGLNFDNDLFCFRSNAWVPVATPPGVKFFTIAANTESDPTFTTWALGVDGKTYRKNPSTSDPAVNNFSMVPGGPTFADIQVVTNQFWPWQLSPLIHLAIFQSTFGLQTTYGGGCKRKNYLRLQWRGLSGALIASVKYGV